MLVLKNSQTWITLCTQCRTWYSFDDSVQNATTKTDPTFFCWRRRYLFFLLLLFNTFLIEIFFILLTFFHWSFGSKVLRSHRNPALPVIYWTPTTWWMRMQLNRSADGSTLDKNNGKILCTTGMIYTLTVILRIFTLFSIYLCEKVASSPS